MNKYLSEKLQFFSFWLMIGVVQLHSVVQTGTSASAMIQRFFSYNLLQICVPMFLLFSGYLFFLNFEKSNINEYYTRIRKRMKTLLFPYVFWAVLVFFFIMLIQMIPQLSSFFPAKFIKMSFEEILLNALIYPFNYPLWFLRELILYVLLTPLIYYGIKYSGFFLVALLFIISLFIPSYLQLDIKLIQTAPFFFFVLGCYFGITKNKLSFLNNLTLLAGAIFIVGNILCFMYDENYFSNDSESFVFIFKLLGALKNIAGVFFFWQLYDYLSNTSRFKKYYQYGFLIFVIHGIPTVMLAKLFNKLIFTPYIGLVYYFGTPLIIITLIIMTGKFLKKTFPRFYKISTGSR